MFNFRISQAVSSHRVAIGFVLSATLILPVILLYPFSSDTSLYECMGMVLVRYGGLPYLASWAHNFPGTPFLHALGIILFGPTMVSLRLEEYLIELLTWVVLFRVSCLWVARDTALLASILFALLYVSGPVGNMGQTDGFVLLPLISAIWITVLAFRSNRPATAVLAGALFGISVWMRPTYGLLFLVSLFMLFPIWNSEKRVQFGAMVGGFIVVFLLSLVPFALQPHGLSEEYLAVIRYNFEVYNPSSYSGDLLARRPLFILGVAVCWTCAAMWRSHRARLLQDAPRNPKERYLLIALFVALLVSIYMMRRAPTYHFIPLYVFSLPVFASLVMQFTKFSRIFRRIAISVILIGAVWYLYPWQLVTAFIGNDMSLSAAYNTVTTDSDRNYTAYREMAQYLQTHTNRADRVETLDPSIQWMTNRQAASRFTTMDPLILGYPPNRFTDYQQRWRSEFISAIENYQAKYIVISDKYDSIHHFPNTTLLREIPGFVPLLEREYHLDTVIHNSSFYRRN